MRAALHSINLTKSRQHAEPGVTYSTDPKTRQIRVLLAQRPGARPRWVGTIEAVSVGFPEYLGFRYRPKGSKTTGQTYTHLADCKASLERE